MRNLRKLANLTDFNLCPFRLGLPAGESSRQRTRGRGRQPRRKTTTSRCRAPHPSRSVRPIFRNFLAHLMKNESIYSQISQRYCNRSGPLSNKVILVIKTIKTFSYRFRFILWNTEAYAEVRIHLRDDVLYSAPKISNILQHSDKYQ